jgi:hypothetical protein
MSFLHDPTLQFVVNVGVALLGIFFTSIITVVIYRRQQTRKGITYKVISDTPILSLKEEVKGKIKVLFGTKPINNVRLVIVKIWNSENTPILPSEYIDPIRLGFGGNVEILDAEILEAIPQDIKDNVKASLKLNIESVILEPLLLNSRDSITLKVLLAQTPLTKELKINARIVGVNQIVNFNKLSPIFRPLSRIFTYFSYFIFLIAIGYILVSRFDIDFNAKVLFLFNAVVFALLYIPLFIIFGSLAYSIFNKENYYISIRFLIEKFINLLRYMIDEEYDKDKV